MSSLGAKERFTGLNGKKDGGLSPGKDSNDKLFESTLSKLERPEVPKKLVPTEGHQRKMPKIMDSKESEMGKSSTRIVESKANRVEGSSSRRMEARENKFSTTNSRTQNSSENSSQESTFKGADSRRDISEKSSIRDQSEQHSSRVEMESERIQEKNFSEIDSQSKMMSEDQALKTNSLFADKFNFAEKTNEQNSLNLDQNNLLNSELIPQSEHHSVFNFKIDPMAVAREAMKSSSDEEATGSEQDLLANASLGLQSQFSQQGMSGLAVLKLPISQDSMNAEEDQQKPVLNNEPLIGQSQSFFQKSSSVMQSGPQGISTYNESEANQMKINHSAEGSAKDQILMAGGFSQKGQVAPKIDGKLGPALQVKDQGGLFGLSKKGDQISLFAEKAPSQEGQILFNEQTAGFGQVLKGDVSNNTNDADLFSNFGNNPLASTFKNGNVSAGQNLQAKNNIFGSSNEEVEASEFGVNGLNVTTEDSKVEQFIPTAQELKLDARESEIYEKLKNSPGFLEIKLAAQKLADLGEQKVNQFEDLESDLDLSTEMIKSNPEFKLNSDINLNSLNKGPQGLSFEDKFEKLDLEEGDLSSVEDFKPQSDVKLESAATSDMKLQDKTEDKNQGEFTNTHFGQSSEVREKPDIAKITSNFNLNSVNAKKSEVTDPNIKQILNQAQYMIRKGGGEVNVQMNPEGLGKVQLKVLVENGKVNLALSAQTDEAKKLLEGGISELKSQLSQHKLLVENVRVDVTHSARDTAQQQMDFSNQQNAREQARQFMGQFRENSWSGRGDSFYEMTGINSYKSQKTVPPLQPAASQGLRPRANMRGSGLNLVA
jgi:hypothetical protein